MEARSALDLPAPFGPYELVDELGQGSTGTVYLARRSELYFAIKVLHPEFAKDLSFLERFQREGEAVAALRHPNIVRIHEAAVLRGQHYIAMEFVDGESLWSYFQSHGLTWQTSLEIMASLFDALAHAHEQGVIHRDIKPANILIEHGGRAVLTDFSEAHLKNAPRITATGALLGTPEYMAPEQFDGKADQRSDIYAAGLVLYELLTGHHPFRGNTFYEVLRLQQAVTPRAASEIEPQVPQEVSKLLIRLLAKEPRHRPKSAAQVAAQLRQILRGERLDVPPEQASEDVQRPPSPSAPSRSAMVGGVAACLALFAFVLVQNGRSQPLSCRAVLDSQPEKVLLALDGKPPELHHSGDQIALRPGSHRVEVSAEGYRRTHLQFWASQEQVARIQAQLQPAQAHLNLANPHDNLTVSIDGAAPFPLRQGDSLLPIKPGSHRLEFRRGHLRSELDITIADGEQKEIELPP